MTKKMAFFKNRTSGPTATLLLLFFLLPIIAALFHNLLKRSNRHLGSKSPPFSQLETSACLSKSLKRFHFRISISTYSQKLLTYAELAKKRTQESRGCSREENEIIGFILRLNDILEFYNLSIIIKASLLP